MRVIYVDIDETIANTPDNPRVYEESKPIKENIEKINKLYDEGNTIVYWTARGSRSKIDWYDLTKSQLEEWGAKHHELRCDKPYYDLFVEDKSIFIENL
jgi:histidinol phosphatase-like enzyme|tara:strand:+ start:780 stop:1076 length:297 start_codon:yes stop_codon:yes gene_type:complete